MMNFGSNQMFCANVKKSTPRGTGAVSPDHPEEEVIRQCDVTVHDVLLGRGRGPNMHPGNQRYREIIYANRDNYNKASNRTEQTRITREIVNHIKQNGRFLKRLEVPKSQKKKKKRGDSNGDAWVVVSDATARLKVGQCLRYKLRQDAEQQEDGSVEDEGYGEENAAQTKEKYSGGAIIPTLETSSTNVVEAEPIVNCQPSRKYRKVEIPEEPALDAEELQVLKAFSRSGLIPEEEDEDLDGFLESPLWEARAESHVLPVEEDDSEHQGSLLGSYYDNMFGNGGSYDSNYAYGADLISDAEVLTALGYPQPPSEPSSRPPVLCYCGCRLKPSEAHLHNHKCMPRNGIFSMPGARPLGLASTPRPRSLSDTLMSEPQEEEPICSVIGSNSNNDNNVMAPNNTSFSMVTPANNGMAPMADIWDAPLRSAPLQSAPLQSAPLQSAPLQSAPMLSSPFQPALIQSAPPGHGMAAPFQVPDSAPIGRPRLYRPFMQNVT